MSFFGNLFSENEVTVEECVDMVEKFMKERGLDPKKQAISNKKGITSWGVVRGSALIYIFILDSEDGSPTIRVVSPILILPDKNILPLYRKCLEINMNLFGCALAVDEDRIVVVSERPINGLDVSELDWMLDHLAHVADEYDNRLADEFGATLASSVQ